MSETYKIYTSNFGMQVHSPEHFVITQMVLTDAPISKLEKRRDAIIYKMKRRKAILNIVFIILFMIVAVPVLVVLGLLLLKLAPTPINAAMIGILIAMSWVCAFYIIASFFEIDIFFIKVKHRGKIY